MTWIAELIDVPVHRGDLGNLVVIEKSDLVPFDPLRTYFIYDVPSGTSRGFHAHKRLQQLMIAVCGSLDVTIDDGDRRERFTLDSQSRGLFIRAGAWREMHNFAPGTVCVVVASEKFDEDDYIRTYSDFIAWKDAL